MPAAFADDVSVVDLLPVVAGWGDGATVEQQASGAGLVLVSDEEPGLTRVRRGRGFSYHGPDGTLLNGSHRARLQSLAIPPAWTDVWICPDECGHLLATGRDDAGRKQYLYHPVWRQLQEAAKFHRLPVVGAQLPQIREAVDQALRLRTLSRDKVIAWVVALLDRTSVRIGDDDYHRRHGSVGLTTLHHEHMEVTGSTIRLCFPGKSGIEQTVEVRDTRLARQLRRAADTPGKRVFTWDDGDGTWRDASASDVNEWLAEVVAEPVTTKDFRTWGATVAAAAHLHAVALPEDPSLVDGLLLEAWDHVAEQLGNTREVARASYVHPLVPIAWREGRLDDCYDRRNEVVDWLSPDERAVACLLDGG